jgi:hypothetical protein
MDGIKVKNLGKYKAAVVFKPGGHAIFSANVVRSWQDERRIAARMPILDDILDRCEETVQHTSCVLLCWLRSTKPQCRYPYG